MRVTKDNIASVNDKVKSFIMILTPFRNRVSSNDLSEQQLQKSETSSHLYVLRSVLSTISTLIIDIRNQNLHRVTYIKESLFFVSSKS